MLDYDVFPEQRQSLIKALLLKDGRVVCARLSQELQVSEHTIRRDLREVAREGLCKRVYGGAVSLAPTSGSFADRVGEKPASKARLGEVGAQLIRDGSCIFIDAGTTNLALATAIEAGLSLTVVTNAPAIAAQVMQLPQCEVIVLGGRLQATTGAALGINALKQVEGMHFDQCFMGACALDVDEGLTVFDYEDAEFKRTLVRRSNEVIVALASDKIPSIARYKVMASDEISILVVEDNLSQEVMAALANSGVDVRTCV